jgi:hypothetical protein
MLFKLFKIIIIGFNSQTQIFMRSRTVEQRAICNAGPRGMKKKLQSASGDAQSQACSTIPLSARLNLVRQSL